MPNVKSPDRFPEYIRRAVANALEGEVLLPFETPRLAKSFRSTVYDYCRAHREHKTELAPKLDSVSVKFYTTHDVVKVRSGYKPGPLYPYTLILDFRPAFTENVAQMQVRRSPVVPGPPVRSRVSPTHYETPPLADDPEYPNETEHDRDAAFTDILNRLDKDPAE